MTITPIIPRPPAPIIFIPHTTHSSNCGCKSRPLTQGEEATIITVLVIMIISMTIITVWSIKKTLEMYKK